jgi:hypothetical protein
MTQQKCKTAKKLIFSKKKYRKEQQNETKCMNRQTNRKMREIEMDDVGRNAKGKPK